MEERRLLAFDLTISTAATAGVTQLLGSFIANASGANINVADMQAQLLLGNDVTISNGAAGAEAGNIIWNAAANLDYNGIAATRSLSITADASSTTGDFSLNSSILDSVAGGDTLNVTVSAVGGVTLAAAINVAGASVSVTAGAAISDGNAAANNVTAANLALDALAGVGASGDPIETTVGNLEARTTTGGIFAANTGNLSIGGVTATLTGIQVVTSGDIELDNVGSITLIDTNGLQTVVGGSTSGNVSLTANGVAADLTSTVNQDAVAAPAGGIALTAGRDIAMGVAGADFDNDVRANGSLTLSAGRNITVDGFSDVSSDDFGNNTGGGVTATAGTAGTGDINITDSFGSDASIGASGTAGADVVLTTAAGGTVNLTAPFTNAVFSNSGDVTVSGDDMVIDAASGITATTGVVTLRQATLTQQIDLGTNSAGNLGLTDAELDRVTASLLRIGRSDSTGTGFINVAAAITGAASYNSTLSLLSGSAGIFDGAAGSLQVTNLAAVSGGGVSLNSGLHQAANVAGGAAGLFGFAFILHNAADLTVGGPIDGATGISNAQGGVRLLADNLAVAQAITTPANQVVELRPLTAARPIDLGSETVGALSLTDAELDLVTTGVLRVGDAAAGAITVTAAITLGANVPTLSLISGGTITDAVGGSVTVANLRASGANGVTLDSALNDVFGSLAGDVSGAGDFVYNDLNALNVGAVDGQTGVAVANGAVAISTASGDLTLSALVSASTVGNTVTLTAGNAIVDGNAAANNVTATNLALDATAGIGASGDPLETTVDNLEARTNTGGIFLANTGDVNIGGVTAALSGIQVITSGDIELINAGSITLIDTNGLQTVGGGSASGNVSLTANGAAADLTSSVDQDAVAAPAGGISLTAGRDISFGVAGANFDNDVRANGSITLSAGRDITVDGFSDVNSDDFFNNTGGGVTATAGTAGTGDINVTDTFGADASIAAGGTAGADVVLTTSAGGTFNLTAPTTAAVFSNSGDVTVSADDIVIDAASGITATTGAVTLRAATLTQRIDLGTNSVGNLGLTDAELDRVTASLLRIGRADALFAVGDSGIVVSAAITAPAGWSTLSLLSGGASTFSLGGTLTVTNLAAAGLSIGLGGANSVTNFAALGTSVAANVISFSNTGDLAIGAAAIDGLTGVTTTNNGGVILDGTAGALLTVDSPITTGVGASANVILTFDDMDINAAISAGAVGSAQSVTLRPTSGARIIDLGTDTAATLGLTDAELDLIATGVVHVGSAANAGGVQVTSQITAPAGYGALSLETGAAILDATGAEQTDITVGNLALRATLGIGAADDLDTAVARLAFSNFLVGLNISNTGALAIDAVDGLAVSSNLGGTTTITAASPLTFAVNTTSAGSAIYTAGEIFDAPIWADDLTVSAGVTVSVTAGDLTLRAGDEIVLGSGAIVTASGTVTFEPMFGDLDQGGGFVIDGTGIDDVMVVTATSANSGSYSLNGAPAVNFTGIFNFAFNGLAGNDILRVINPAGSLFAPLNGIAYNGGTQTLLTGDSLEILGGTETTATYTFTTTDAEGHAGTIALAGGATANYTFTGLEPILNTGTVTDIIFNLPDQVAPAGDDLVLEDDAVPANGQSQLRSVNGTFETTVFANPSGSLTINAGAGNDRGTSTGVDSLFAASVTVNGDADDDTLIFSDGMSLGGGTFDGGAGTDTLDYAAYTTAVAVNLGANAPGLTASLQASQEVPGTSSIAAGTATLTFNSATKTFDIAVTVTDLNPATVTGFHIHRAPFGVNGPIIVDFGTGSLVPAGTGFTFNATGLALPPQHEAALLGGITYVNVHTAAFPAGVIRGQLFPSGLFVAAAATATGTAGISNVENAVGGSAADSLVGNLNANALAGGPGNDTIVATRGNDAMSGEAGDDVLVWSNGDNDDVINGGANTDLVQVNGALGAGDAFTINAGVGGRVDFDRTNLIPFSLDIGTVETLTVNGITGNDTFTVGSLAGVADLTLLNLNGLDGNDAFSVVPAATTTINVNGGSPVSAPGDSLDVDLSGTTSPATTSTAGGAGQWTFGNRSPVGFISIEQLTPVVDTIGLLQPSPAVFFLRNSNSVGFADLAFEPTPANPGWIPIAGDWDGDGDATVGLYDPVASTFRLWNSNASGSADITFAFGAPGAGWRPLAGDWNNDGTDTVGLYSPGDSTFMLRNANSTGIADVTFGYGAPGADWLPIAGDWNSDNSDTIGLFSPNASAFFLRNANSTGIADVTFGYGAPGAGWLPIAGDWNNDNADTIGLYSPGNSVFFLRNANSAGFADLAFGYGEPGWLPIAGDWTGLPPLLAADGLATAGQPQALDPGALERVLDAARARWADAGVALGDVRVVLSDLPGARLGAAGAGVIHLDRDAAGHGWFVDSTPSVDEEFVGVDAGSDLRAVNAEAVDRIDLLTVIEHELGHIAGLDDLATADSTLMSGTLPTGVRRPVSPS